MGAGWLVGPRPDGRRTRVSSFVCDMRVLFADPVSRCPGIGIWFLALQLVLALLGEKSNGYSVSKCREWGEMTIVFFSLSRSTRLLKCLVVRSGSGGRDNEGQRLALAIDVFLPWCSSVPGHAIGATHRPPRHSWPCRPPIARHAHETISRPVTSKPIHAIPQPAVRQQNPLVHPIGIVDCMREPSWSILRCCVGRGVAQDGELMRALQMPWVVNGTAGRDRE